MKKNWILGLLILALVCSALPMAAATEAEETTETTGPVREPGQCGEDMYWTFENDTLTITGSGTMDDFQDEAPWAKHKDAIVAVILEGEITYIGARAFYDYDRLELVDFGSHLYEIGEEAFRSCGGLTAITLPQSFKIFGPSSFLGCANLKQIHCAGGFPSFRLNCLWDTYATIYYPAERPWPVSTIADLEEAFHGRIEFLASDGTDHYQPTEETEAAEESTGSTEVTTEPTEETTEPAGETTEPAGETTEPTQVTTEPAHVTEAPTEAPSQATEDPTQAADPAPQEEEAGAGSLTGLLIVAAVMVPLVAGALIFRMSNRGKYSGRGKKR